MNREGTTIDKSNCYIKLDDVIHLLDNIYGGSTYEALKPYPIYESVVLSSSIVADAETLKYLTLDAMHLEAEVHHNMVSQLINNIMNDKELAVLLQRDVRPDTKYHFRRYTTKIRVMKPIVVSLEETYGRP